MSLPIPQNSPAARRLARAPFLVIDDSPFVRRTVREILNSVAVRTVADAADGRQGLSEARKYPPRVIILDWVMPVLSGAEFMRVLRYSRESPAPHADVVVITGHPTLKVVADAQRYGVAAIIRKPFSPATLLERLLGPALRLHRPAEPARAVAPSALRSRNGAASVREAGAYDRPLADFDGDGSTWAI